MKDFFNSPAGFYVIVVLLNAVALFLHKGKKKVEEVVSEIATPEESVKVNDFLDTVERLTSAAVQDANSRIVSGLKEKNLFTPEVATSVKQSVIQNVLDNLGPMKDKGTELVGPIDSIISQLIEKNVVESKSIPAKQG